MPVLKDFRKTVELTLPVTKGKVWIYNYMIAGDSLEIDKIYVTETELSIDVATGAKPISIRAAKFYEAQDETMKAMIQKWDFTDEKEKPIEPTIENIKKLPKQDYDYLLGEIEERVKAEALTKEQKKN